VLIFPGSPNGYASKCGMKLVIDDRSFRRRQIVAAIRPPQAGCLSRTDSSDSIPKVKIDLTTDEFWWLSQRCDRSATRYSDGSFRRGRSLLLAHRAVRREAPGSRRALSPPRPLRRRPHAPASDLIGLAPEVALILARKCAHAGLTFPTLSTIHDSPYSSGS